MAFLVSENPKLYCMCFASKMPPAPFWMETSKKRILYCLMESETAKYWEKIAVSLRLRPFLVFKLVWKISPHPTQNPA